MIEGLPAAGMQSSAAQARAPSLPALATSQRGGESPFVLAVRCLGLIFAEAASLAMAAWGTFFGDHLFTFAAQNQLTIGSRKLALLSILGAGLAAMIAAVSWLAFARRASLVRLTEVAARLAPLSLVFVVPFAFRVQIWQAKALTFAVTISILAVLLPRLLLMSFAAPPLFGTFSPAWYLRRSGSRAWAVWGPRLLPASLVLATLLHAAFFGFHAWRALHSLQVTAPNLVREVQRMQLMLHGAPWRAVWLAPAGASANPEGALFGYVLAPLAWVVPANELLLVGRALALSMAALPLYWLARQRLGAAGAWLVALAYLLYAPAQNQALSDFDYLAFGPLFLWTFVAAGLASRRWLCAVALTFALLLGTKVAVCAACLSVYLALRGRDVRGALIAALLAGAAAWFLATLWPAAAAAPGTGAVVEARASSAVFTALLANPFAFAQGLIDSTLFIQVVSLAAPLCFIPWWRADGYLLSLPGVYFILLAPSVLPNVRLSLADAPVLWAPAFVALVGVVQRISQPGHIGDTAGTSRRRAALCALLLLAFVTSHQAGYLLQQEGKLAFGSYRFEFSERERMRADAFAMATRVLPPGARSAVSPSLLAAMAGRFRVSELERGFAGAEYLVLQLEGASAEARQQARAALAGDFGVVSARGSFVVARRGHSKVLNASVALD